jgi:hypothetical protein
MYSVKLFMKFILKILNLIKMRKITREIVNAFQNSRSLTIGNSRTDGESLWLFGNKIAEIQRDGLWISNGGWDSRTTKERLNGLSGVNIQQVRGTWFLNGREWNGRWVNLDAWNDGIEYATTGQPVQVADEIEFDITSEWTNEGYSRPQYSIYYTLVEVNLEPVEAMLNGEGIPTKRMESDTDGVYRPNYFVVVRPEDVVRASSILCENYSLI